MSGQSIPTFAYPVTLDSQRNDVELVPVNIPVSWLVIGAYTTDTFPSQVPLTVQLRFGAGPWLTVPLPFTLSGMALPAPDHGPHTGGVNLRADAAPGVQVIAEGGP